MGAGAAVALAARMTGGQKKEDESVWVSSAKLWIKCFDVKTCTKTGCSYASQKTECVLYENMFSISVECVRYLYLSAVAFCKRGEHRKESACVVCTRRDPLRDLQSTDPLNVSDSSDLELA